MAAKQGKYGVFISYCHEDAQYVSPIVEIISASRPDLVFQDTKAIVKGKKWGPQLQEALEQASLVIVFWCKHSAHSQYVKDEYEKAIQSRKDILPVLLDDCDLDPELADYQWIDLQNVTTHQKGVAAPRQSASVFRFQTLLIVLLSVVVVSAAFFFMQKSSTSKPTVFTDKHSQPDNAAVDTASMAGPAADTSAAGNSAVAQLNDLMLEKKKNQEALALLVEQMKKQPAHYQPDPVGKYHNNPAERVAWQSRFKHAAAITDSLNRKMNDVYARSSPGLVEAQSIRKLHARQQQVNQQLAVAVLQPGSDSVLEANIKTSRALDDSLSDLIAKTYPAITNAKPQIDSVHANPVIPAQTKDLVYKQPVFIALIIALLLGGIAIARNLYLFAQKRKRTVKDSNIAVETLMNEINLKLPAGENV